jgi:predicted peptidase
MALASWIPALACAPLVVQSGIERHQGQRLTSTEEIRYLLYLPDGYGESRETWPLLLFLHGAGERGSDLGLVAIHGPPKLIESGEAFPFIVVSPQQAEGGWWSARSLYRLLEHLMSELRVDRERVYLTGLSMGAFGAFDLAADHPDLFAAIVAISGGEASALLGWCPFMGVPIRVFHGELDEVVPARLSREVARQLEGCGNEVELTIYPGVGHDAWTQTYEDPALWEWLLQQRRRDP